MSSLNLPGTMSSYAVTPWSFNLPETFHNVTLNLPGTLSWCRVFFNCPLFLLHQTLLCPHIEPYLALWYLFRGFHVCGIDHLSHITTTWPQTSIAFIWIMFPVPPRPPIFSTFIYFLPDTSPSALSVIVLLVCSITIPPPLTANLIVGTSLSPSPLRPTTSL